MRRKEDEFPHEDWFGEQDSHYYPKIACLYTHLLRPDGRVLKLLKARKTFRPTMSVDYACLLCKKWLQPNQVEEHLQGKIHEKGLKKIKNVYEVINIDHELFPEVYQHMSGRAPPLGITAMVKSSKPGMPNLASPKLLPLISPDANKIQQSSTSQEGSKSPQKSLSLPKPVHASLLKEKKVATSLAPPLAVVRPGAHHAHLNQLPPGIQPVPPPSGIQPVPPPTVGIQPVPPPTAVQSKSVNPVLDKNSDIQAVKHMAVSTPAAASTEKPASPDDQLFLKENPKGASNYFQTCRDIYLIGLEYIVEVCQDNMLLPALYACRLCDVVFHPRGNKACTGVMKSHINLMSHKLKYLQQYFPTIYEHKKLKVQSSEGVITEIVKDIEWVMGRLQIRMFKGKDTFTQKLSEIDKAIKEGEHFRETQEIVDIVMKKRPLPKSSKLDQIFDIEDETIEATSDVKDKNTTVDVDVESMKSIIETVNKQTKDKQKELGKDCDKTDADDKGVNDKSNKKENVEENLELEEDKLSEISNEDLVTKEDKLQKHRKEREARVIQFKAEVEQMEKALNKLKEEFSENPSTHPDYSREWSKFYRKKSEELHRKNIRPEGMDFKPEWIVQWTQYFESEFVNRRTKARASLMRKYKLLQRDIDEVEARKSLEKELSPISDKQEDEELEEMVGQPWKKNQQEPARPSSPWEEDGFFMTKNRSNSGTPVRDERSPQGGSQHKGGRLPKMFSDNREKSPFSARQRREGGSPFLSRVRQRSPSSLLTFQNPSSPTLGRPSSRRSNSPRGEKRKGSPMAGPSRGHQRSLDRKDEEEDDRTSNVSGTNDVSVLSTLRLMSALDQAGFLKNFGREIDEQLARALSKENQRKGSSFDMVHEKACYKLLLKAKEKLQAIMTTNTNLNQNENKVIRIILDNLIIFNQRTSLTPEDLEKLSPEEEDRNLKMAIAKTISQHLAKQGRTVSDDDFSFLIESEFKRVKQRRMADVAQSHQQSSRPAEAYQDPRAGRRSAEPYQDPRTGRQSGDSEPYHSRTGGPAEPYQDPRTSRPTEPYQDPRTGKPADPYQDPRTGRPTDPYRDPRTGRESAERYQDSRTGRPSDPYQDPRTGRPTDPYQDPRTGRPSDPYQDSRTGRSAEPYQDPRTTRPADLYQDPRAGRPADPYQAPRTSREISRDRSSQSPIPSSYRGPSPASRPTDSYRSSLPRNEDGSRRGMSEDPSVPGPSGHGDQRSSVQRESSSRQHPPAGPSDYDQLSRRSASPYNYRGPGPSSRYEPPQPSSQPSPPPPTTAINSSSVDVETYEDDVYIEFTDEELVSLLCNFNTLEPLEQKDLISHMKKLERTDPERVKRLKEAMNKK